MNTTVRFLCSSEGVPLYVQMPYDEYVRLDQAGLNAARLHARRKQITDLLTFDRLTTEPEKIVKPGLVAKSRIIPEPATEPLPAPGVREPEPLRAPMTREPSAVAPVRVVAANVAIPPVLLAFLNEQDPSGDSKRLIEACVRKLSGLCGKRITMSLHKPYICLWDFDEWMTFAYGEIIRGNLFLSIDRNMMPNAARSDIWTPPSGLSKKALARMKVETVTDELIARLQRVLDVQAGGSPEKQVQI